MGDGGLGAAGIHEADVFVTHLLGHDGIPFTGRNVPDDP
jgi:hypothetical protein